MNIPRACLDAEKKGGKKLNFIFFSNEESDMATNSAPILGNSGILGQN